MAYPRLIESLAEITACRDRDQIESSIMCVTFDLLRPVALRLFRLVDPIEGNGVLRIAIGRYVGNGELSVTVSDPMPVSRERMPTDVCERMEPRSARSHTHPECYSAVLPIVAEGRAVGWVEAETALPLGEDQYRMIRALLDIYANHLAVLDYGEHDTLTGLRNRKTFDTFFLKRLEELRAIKAEPHWIGVIDIDHFKRINDRFGHLFGDEVLMLIARIMRGAFRAADLLYRFGGEEFVVQAAPVDSAGAEAMFEALREKVADYRFPQVGQVTISIGFTPIEFDDTPTTAFDRADEALYRAKEQGRNRCIGARRSSDSRASASQTVQGEVLLF